ncbi:MAG: Csp1 family four helix bundle copper storage protein [Polyangiales bacterium]
MSTRRDVLAGVASLGALLSAAAASAQPKTTEPAKADHAGHAHAHEAPAAAPLSPQLAAIIESTAACQRDGRYCLARCTDHLAAGAPAMAACQRTVMNMLAVTAAMAEVAGYRNANAKHIKALTTACAQFCRACAAACEAHKDHHEECKACFESCLTCAKACEAYTA